MSFRANLQCLRARHNMTQEQLAMLLGVSRQSVTKWESGRAYPEMDKLIKMCAIFGCTLDGLVQGDLADATRTSTAGQGEVGAVTGGTRADGGREDRPGDAEAGAPGAGKLSGRGSGSIAGEGSSAKPLHVSDGPVQDVCGYDEQMRRFAFQIPTGVALCIAGFVPRGLLENVSIVPGAEPGVLATVSLFLGVLAGLAMIIPACMGRLAFQRAHPFVQDFYTEQDRLAARRMFATRLISGIAFIMAGLLFNIAVDGTTLEDVWGSAALFGGAAIGVWLIIHGGMMLGRTNIRAYNNEDAVDNLEFHELESLDIPEHERERLIAAKRVNNRAESVCGIIMLMATIVALSWLFGSVLLEGGIDAEGAWERAAHQPFWLPWIIGGLTCAIASIIIQERDDRGR